ncbi:MAG: carboxypeptidase-like regulatory domain-containing protein [Planctomycetota bacterium]
MARLAPLLALALFLSLGTAWLCGLIGGGAVEAHDRARPVLGPSDDLTGAGSQSSPGTLEPVVDLGFGRAEVAADEAQPDDLAEEDAAAAGAAEVADGDPPQVIGRILDSEGAPLAGATVVGATGWVQSFPFELEDLGDANDWMQRARAVTDAEGRFALVDGLRLGGELVLFAAAPGHAPLRLDRPPPSARGRSEPPLDFGDLQLNAGAIARGRVTDRRGNAVPGARVSLAVVLGEQSFGVDFPSRGVPLVTTGDDGTFELNTLERGPFTILVDAPGRTVARQSAVAGTRPLESLVVVLEAGSSISGKVVGRPATGVASEPAATAAAGAEVGLAAAPGGGAAHALRVEARPGKPDGSTVSGIERAQGGARHAPIVDDAFEVNGLVDGLPYTLIVSEDVGDGEWKRVAEVDPTEGSPGTRGVELRWNPRRSAAIHVVDDETGAPVEEMIVGWCVTDKRRNRDNFRTIMDDEPEEKARRHFDGGLVTLEKLPPGKTALEIKVRVTAVGYETKTAENLVVKADPSTDLGEIRLKPAASVRVKVIVGETEEPVEGAKVYLAKKEYEYLDWWAQNGAEVYDNEDVSFGMTDAEGFAVLAALPGERVNVTASSAQFVALEPVEALLPTTGVHDLTVKLTQGGTIVAKVRRPNGRPAEGVKVQCTKEALPGARGNSFVQPRYVVSDAEGVARFERLPAGMHDVRVSTEGQVAGRGQPMKRSANVRVGEEVSIVLDSPSVGLLTGLVLESGQPLARASLSLSTSSNDDDNNFGWWGDEGSSAQRTSSRGDGSYSLGPLEAGEWFLTVRHPGRAMALRMPVRILEGANTFDVRLDVALLEGRVVDEDGAPLRGININVRAQGENFGGGSQTIRMKESPTGDVNLDWEWQQLDSLATPETGLFAFRGVVTGRPLQLGVRHAYIQPIELELSDFADGELRDLGDLVAKAAGAARIRRASGGRERFKARLIRLPPLGASGPDAQESLFGTASVRGNSSASMNSIPPGRYRAELLAADNSVVQEREIEVVARETVQVVFD